MRAAEWDRGHNITIFTCELYLSRSICITINCCCCLSSSHSHSHSVMEHTWKYKYLLIGAYKLTQPRLIFKKPKFTVPRISSSAPSLQLHLNLEWAFGNVDHHNNEMGRQVHLRWVQLRLWKQFQIWLDLQNSSKWWIKLCNGDWGHWKREPIQDYKKTAKGGLLQCQCWSASEHGSHWGES